VELDVHIELAAGTNSIHGAVVPASGARIEFSGWLGLAAVLGELLDQAPPVHDDG
jgi:hypothetical protein